MIVSSWSPYIWTKAEPLGGNPREWGSDLHFVRLIRVNGHRQQSVAGCVFAEGKTNKNDKGR